MFGVPSLEKQINILQGYIDINDIIYQEQLIKEEFDKLDDELRTLVARNIAGIKGYEQYTEQYACIKRVELLENLFKNYSSFDAWSKRLKLYLMTNDKKVFQLANMTLGQDKYVLSPTEILLNEEQAKRRLSNLKITLKTEDTYKKK